MLNSHWKRPSVPGMWGERVTLAPPRSSDSNGLTIVMSAGIVIMLFNNLSSTLSWISFQHGCKNPNLWGGSPFICVLHTKHIHVLCRPKKEDISKSHCESLYNSFQSSYPISLSTSRFTHHMVKIHYIIYLISWFFLW